MVRLSRNRTKDQPEPSLKRQRLREREAVIEWPSLSIDEDRKIFSLFLSIWWTMMNDGHPRGHKWVMDHLRCTVALKRRDTICISSERKRKKRAMLQQVHVRYVALTSVNYKNGLREKAEEMWWPWKRIYNLTFASGYDACRRALPFSLFQNFHFISGKKRKEEVIWWEPWLSFLVATTTAGSCWFDIIKDEIQEAVGGATESQEGAGRATEKERWRIEVCFYTTLYKTANYVNFDETG